MVYVYMGDNSRFESQSSTIIKRLMEKNGMSREEATNFWFHSATYKEIIKRKLTYISAMRAYSELRLEHKKSPDWMQKSFE